MHLWKTVKAKWDIFIDKYFQQKQTQYLQVIGHPYFRNLIDSNKQLKKTIKQKIFNCKLWLVLCFKKYFSLVFTLSLMKLWLRLCFFFDYHEFKQIILGPGQNCTGTLLHGGQFCTEGHFCTGDTFAQKDTSARRHFNTSLKVKG